MAVVMMPLNYSRLFYPTMGMTVACELTEHMVETIKNYSLMSLVEKIENIPAIEMKVQETQTDYIETHTIEATPKKKRQPKAESEKKAMNFKLTQDKAGQLKGITIKFAN